MNATGDPCILEATVRHGSDAMRALEELSLLEDHGIKTCLWGEDALIHYHVPTNVFSCLFVLIPDDLVDAAVECLTKTGNWRLIPNHPKLAQTFEISIPDMNRTFSSFRMLERSPVPLDKLRDFMFVFVPAKSFAHFTIDNTTMVPNTRTPIPTYPALLDSLIDTVVSAGRVYFTPTTSEKDKRIASAIFQRMTLWYNYLMEHNRDYIRFIPEVISEKNKPIASFLALPRHVMSQRHWRKLCELRGVVPPRDTPKTRVVIGNGASAKVTIACLDSQVSHPSPQPEP